MAAASPETAPPGSDPVVTEPAGTEPVATAPVASEPVADTEPVVSQPAGSEAATSESVADDAGSSVPDAAGGEFSLTIAHINDHHSHLEPSGGSVDLGTEGGEFDYELGGFARVVTKFAEIEASADNLVKIHAGDAITGTLFYTLFAGEADAAMMNEVCFDLFEPGNHEFDGTDAALATFLDYLNADQECGTLTLGANIVPAAGTPLAPAPSTQYLRPYHVMEFGADRVGFIGLDIAGKTTGSSSPLDTTWFLDEAETAQRYVDELNAMDVDNIVLVTHYGYDNDLALAGQVTGIDAIIGGDSHTLLGDFDAFGLTSLGDYPTMTTNADGDPVCVVQAWQYSAVVGELNLDFDDGRLAACDGTPHLLIGSTFTRENDAEEVVAIEGDELAEITAAIDAMPNVSIAEPDPEADAILAGFAEQTDALASEVIGTATEPLCSNRLPGDSGDAVCDPDQAAASGALANVNGGFIQQVVSDAYLARAFRADLAIQNAGGVRISIPTGDISVGTAYELLPFANTLVELDLTGAEIEQSLEEAVSYFLDNPDGGGGGSYPYGSAIRWDVDLSAAPGERFSNVEVRGDDGAWAPIDPAATYIVVTNSFLSGGGDGFLTFGTATGEGRAVDTGIDYAQGFIDWLVEDAGGEIVVPAPEDFSTQSFVAPAG